MVALEAAQEMPAHEYEIEEAEDEGIRILHRLGPHRIVGDRPRRGTRNVRRLLGVRRERPVQPAVRRGHRDVDRVRLGDPRDRPGARPLLARARRWRRVSPPVGRSPSTVIRSRLGPGVYAGGDAAFGPRNLIDAIADGRRAAASIHAQHRRHEAPGRARRAGGGCSRHRGNRPVRGLRRRARVPIPSEPTNAGSGCPRSSSASRRSRRDGGGTVPPVLPEHRAGTVALHPVRWLRRRLPGALHPDRPGEAIDGVEARRGRPARSCSRRTAASGAGSASTAVRRTRCRSRVGPRRPPHPSRSRTV